jgi:hypothetical protein
MHPRGSSYEFCEDSLFSNEKRVRDLFYLTQGGKENMIERSNYTININEILWKIRHLKEEAERSSWLLGEELTHKIIEVLEEKEKDVIENLMWFA